MPNRLLASVTHEERRVLLLPPTSRDADALRGLLDKERIPYDLCLNMTGICEAIRNGAGVVVVSEESLTAEGQLLLSSVESQEVWSDLPLIVLSRSGVEAPAFTVMLESLGNASVLERPVRMSTLVSVIRSAIRARLRQYQVRDYLAERARTEASLRHGREQMEMVVGGADVGVWFCPLPFDVMNWDDKVKEHFHLPSESEVTIDTFYERLHPDDRERTRLAIERSIAEKIPYEIDYRTVSPDGTQFKWIRAIGRAYYDESGSPIRFDGITIDVTNRIRIEAELRASEERLQLAIQTGKLGVWELELATENLTCSAAFKTNFGRKTSDEFTYIDLRKAIHADDRDRVAEIFNHAIHERTSFETECRTVWPDGELRWILVRGQLDCSRDGLPDRLIGVTLDITERKVVEERRTALLEAEREARSEAEHAGRMKDEFLATLSHELRTPLSAILGWAQILKMNPSPSADINEGIDVIERNAHAQAQIIDDLLDMNRIVSGKIRLDLKQIELASIVRAAIDTVQPAADAKVIRIDANLDAAITNMTLDPNRMQQVLWNLLSNSVKFTPKNGRITVGLDRVESHVEIHVVDDGEGISEEFLPHVFDRFRQADAATTRKFGGLGLGLAIVKQLVELHGGTIRAESAGIGRGSRFVVSLPIGAVAPEEEPEVQTAPNVHEDHAPPATAEMEYLKGLKVLVVDDEPDARHMIQRLLQNHGVVATVAGSVDEAMTLIREFRPDAVLSDIGMPGEDGFSLIYRLRKLSPREGADVPAIALTAYAREEDRRKILDAGFQTYLTKPVNSVELIAALVEHHVV